MASKTKTEKPAASTSSKPKDSTKPQSEPTTVICPVCAYQFKPGDPRL